MFFLESRTGKTSPLFHICPDADLPRGKKVCQGKHIFISPTELPQQHSLVKCHDFSSPFCLPMIHILTHSHYNASIFLLNSSIYQIQQIFTRSKQFNLSNQGHARKDRQGHILNLKKVLHHGISLVPQDQCQPTHSCSCRHKQDSFMTPQASCAMYNTLLCDKALYQL